MREPYKFELTVEPENLEKVQKLLRDNKDLFTRIYWNETKVMIGDK